MQLDPKGRSYLDFDVFIREGQGRDYPVDVQRSPAGEGSSTLRFPFGEWELKLKLQTIQTAILRPARSFRRALAPEDTEVQGFGTAMFEALFSGQVRELFDQSRQEAERQGRGLRVKLHIQAADLTALPWEFLYDPRRAQYLCLSRQTPLVRYLNLPRAPMAMTVEAPLRILAMVAAPHDQAPLNVAAEQGRIEEALHPLTLDGSMELVWLDGTWRALQRAMRDGPWHIFHFVGHGRFDPNSDEGLLEFEGEQGQTHTLSATQLADLLGDEPALRLVVLNACEGAAGGGVDIFSGTASILVRRGIPAVLAMQYEITDVAAIELARTFYECIADGWPVDAAVTEARKAISVSTARTVEWATPVLYMRSSDGLLFNVARTNREPADVQGPTERPDGVAQVKVDTDHRAEEEARRADEARRAEEEARRADEARRAEEEVRLRAEEEVRLRAEEEARLRAEEEVRLRAEEEARLRAEEEVRLRAEEEARLRAEEEARLRAEEEARLRAEGPLEPFPEPEAPLPIRELLLPALTPLEPFPEPDVGTAENPPRSVR